MGWPTGRHFEDGEYRCDLPAGTVHGDQPADENLEHLKTIQWTVFLKDGPKRPEGPPESLECEDQETIRGIVSPSTDGMNTKLHAIADADVRPIRFFMTAGQVSEYTGAAALLGSLSKATGGSLTEANAPTWRH